MTGIAPWQKRQWNSLLERFRAGRMPHALLLTGPAGIGKLAFGRRLAQALLCQNPAEDGQPCGQCRTCRLFVAGSHPDYLHLTLEEDSKVIKIDQVRGLVAGLNLRAQLSGYRVGLIAPADRMNNEAANSLLKTLEEPGPDTVLILVAHQAGYLPATIRSRCQQVVFQLPPPEQARDWLRQAGVEQPEKLLGLAAGAPLAALALAESDGLARRQALVTDFVGIVSGRKDPIAVAAAWEKSDLPELVGWLSSWTMDMVRLKQAPESARATNLDLLEDLKPVAEGVDLKALFAHLDRLQEAARLAQTQVGAQAVLEHILLPWRSAAGSR